MCDKFCCNSALINSFSVIMLRDEEFSSSLNNKATFLGFTPLHYAVLVDNKDIVKLLIKHGANPTLQNDLGHTPIMYAQADSEIKPLLEKEMSKVSSVRPSAD